MKTESKNSFFYRILCGAFLGISIIAPGISGSIMAVMMGIYDDLIDIISNPFKNFKRNVLYVFPMGIGALISMAAFLQILNYLFEHYPTPAYLLFISLIAGSIPTVFKEANSGSFKKSYIAGISCAFLFALTIGMMARFDVSVAVDTTTASAATMRIYFPICGAVAGITSMIPGMSVSMMLMMLNVYEPLLKAAAGFDVITVLPVAVCFLIGMVLFSNLTKYVFRRFHSFGYFLVLGFMSGSIISVFPGLPSGAVEWVFSIIGIGIGIGISLLFRMLGRKFNAEEPEEE